MNSNSFKETTILIVDDSPTNLNLLSGFIDDCGWKFLIATHSYQAIEIAEIEQPDLILLDVMMPEIDGFETCKYLKNYPPTHDIPIIFMTAVTDKLENGLVGLLIFLAYIYIAIKQGATQKSYGIIAASVLVAFATTSLFNSHFKTFPEGHLLAFFVGCLLAQQPTIKDKKAGA